jgi:16S rRNA (uracil1498-N3)-methyltransferase
VSLPRLRLENCINQDGIWLIDAEQAHHLVRVRRCCNGSLVEGLLDGEKIELKLIYEGDFLRAAEVSRETELPMYPEIHLLLGVLKNDQFDDALRFAAETGVHTIHLLQCDRSVPHYSDDKLVEKMFRWRKILNESTKQAGSTRPPILCEPVGVKKLDFTLLPKNRFAALLSPDACALKDLNYGDSVAIALGPEGDWSPAEIQRLLIEEFIPVSLGKRILRASTAVAAACSWFMLN